MDSDAALLSKWITTRDADAFAELVSRHSAMVYGTCKRILRNATAAEDVSQECFIELAQAKKTIRPSLGGWLYTAASRRALNFARSEKRGKQRESRFAASIPEQHEMKWDDVGQHVDDAIAALPQKLRDVIVYRFLEGQSHDATAEHLGIARSTVQCRVKKGIESIRTFLKKRRIEVSAGILTSMMTVELAEATTVPTSLTEVLGKLALAGTEKMVSTGAVSGIAALGGMLAMKKIFVTAAVVVTALIGMWAATEKLGTNPTQSDLNIDLLTEEKALREEVPRSVKQPPEVVFTEMQDESTQELVIDGIIEGGMIAGRVHDADTGLALGPLEIEAYRHVDGERVSKKTDTDDDGKYEIAGLSEGKYFVNRGPVEGYPDPSQNVLKQVEVKEGQLTTNVDFRLSKGLRVTGKVIDADGQPVDDAQIRDLTFEGGWNYTDSDNSDQDGSFELLGFVAQKRFIIQARKEGLMSKPAGPFTVGSDGYHGVKLVMYPLTSVAGRLVDRRGRPLADKKVGSLSESQDIFYPYSAETDENGNFELTDFYPGLYTIAVAPQGDSFNPGSRNRLKEIEIKAGQDITGLVLIYDEDEGLAITGKITDRQENPIHRATVSAFCQKYNSHQTALTDENGYYRLENLVEGLFQISVYSASHTPPIREEIWAGTNNVDFVLDGLGQISGRVVRANNGDSVTNFEILQYPGIIDKVTPSRREEAIRVHDNEGRFSLTDVRLQDVTVIVMALGFATAFETVTVESAEIPVANLVIRLEGESVVQGEVVNEAGHAIAGALIGVGQMGISEEWREEHALVRTNDDGSFRLEGMSSKQMNIWAFHPRYSPVSVEVEPAAVSENPVEIMLVPGASIEGTVRQGERPIRRASVKAGGSYVSTNSNGNYRHAGLNPGLISVRVSLGSYVVGSSYQVMERLVEAESGEVTQVDFDFQEGDADVEVYITSEGKPPKSAEVAVTLATESGERQEYGAMANDTGYCRLHGLPSGTVPLFIRAESASGLRRKKVLELDAIAGHVTTVEVDLSGTGSISGTITDFQNGSQIRIGIVQGTIAIDEGTFGPDDLNALVMIANARPDETGAFRVEGLESDTYTIVAVELKETEDGNPGIPVLYAHTFVEVVDGKGSEVTLIRK